MRRFTTHRGYLGDGFNPLNWIHMDDMIGLITFALINNHVNGVLNGVAPNLVNHQDLAKEMKLGRSVCVLLKLKTLFKIKNLAFF